MPFVALAPPISQASYLTIPLKYLEFNHIKLFSLSQT